MRCRAFCCGTPASRITTCGLASAAPGVNYELLVVGGQGHNTGQDLHPLPRYDEIEAWARARFPNAGQAEYRWSGRVMEPSDGIALLGRNPMDDGNVYIGCSSRISATAPCRT